MKNQKGFSAVEGLLLLILVGLIGFTGWYVYKTKSSLDSTYSNSVSKTQEQTKTPSSSSTTGSITGNASYPAEGLPADEQVCAEKISEPSVKYCDSVGARQKPNTCAMGDPSCEQVGPNLSFKIDVPAGDYYVYATAEKELPGYKAYWDQYAQCGNSADCPTAGHTQYLKVTVTAGETISDVSPSDWYKQ